MSEPKWTKGPWVIEPHKSWDPIKREYAPDEGCYTGIGPLWVDCTYADDDWIVASAADAHLIAAAPDLYDALLAVDRMFSEPRKYNATTVKAMVRDALAKARGEE